jgi:uncharacterized protein YjbI with pentapeptide repeats
MFQSLADINRVRIRKAEFSRVRLTKAEFSRVNVSYT